MILKEVAVMLLINRLGLYAGLLLALTADAGAQQRDCFTVALTSSTAGGSLGSILLDRCTGKSWILVRAVLSNGATAQRWSPITVEKDESVSAPPAGLR
jgi:hypothetical protein